MRYILAGMVALSFVSFVVDVKAQEGSLRLMDGAGRPSRTIAAPVTRLIICASIRRSWITKDGKKR